MSIMLPSDIELYLEATRRFDRALVKLDLKPWADNYSAFWWFQLGKENPYLPVGSDPHIEVTPTWGFIWTLKP